MAAVAAVLPVLDSDESVTLPIWRQELEVVAAAASFREHASRKAPVQGLEALTICRPQPGGSAKKRWRVVSLDQSMDAAAAEEGIWTEL